MSNVCKFFLEGRCRYGDNCRFDHPRGGTGGAQRNLFGSGGGQKVSFRDSFGTASGNHGGNNQYKWVANQNSGGQPATQSTSAVDLVNLLPKEMENWEKTKMWPFSCISVEKDAPSLPGFEDTSVEELRLEYYETQKTGNVAPYTQRLQNLVTEFQNKRTHIKNMSMDIKQKLVSFIDEARKNKVNQTSPTTSSNAFAQPSGTSANQTNGLFGQSSGGSLFGKTSTFSPPGSALSGQTSLFGKPQSTSSSLFGSNSNQTTQGQGSIFGGSSSSASIFGGQSVNNNQSQQPSAGLFGNSQSPKPTPSIFGSPAGSSPQTGLFGKPANAGTSSVFGSSATPPTGLFGGNQQNSSTTSGLFGQGSSAASTTGTGLFGSSTNQPQPQPGLFGGGNTSSVGGGGLLPTPAAAGSAGLFGNSANPSQPPSGLFGNASTTASAPSPGGAGLLPTPSGTVGAGLFGKGTGSPAPGLFSQTPPPQGAGLFGKGPAVGGAGLFGKAAPANISSGANPSVPDANVNKGRHSLMEDLTEQDIEQFKASAFTLGKIPIKPPPRELVII